MAWLPKTQSIRAAQSAGFPLASYRLIYLQAQGLEHERAAIVVSIRVSRLEILPNLTE